ncbi:RNA dependent RNA polymerase-domain-containing protein [Coprinopsis sp. MPI-PUGE-AT-0042]|nr:RNA dependent RNA polymerase-domain-containing protein [Coprinopsis sp. MPI-PUGE-AT-0042]
MFSDDENPFLDRSRNEDDAKSEASNESYPMDADDLELITAEIISPAPPSTSQKRRIFLDSDDSPRPSKISRVFEPYTDLLEGLGMTPAMLPIYRRMPFGLQYELTRQLGARNLRFDRFQDATLLLKLGSVETNVKGMALLPSVLRSVTDLNNGAVEDHEAFNKLYEREIKAKSPWEELDQEEAILKRGDVLAMHGYDVNESPTGWYGGKVSFRGCIIEDTKGTYRVKLEEPELGPSRNLMRRFGSKNVFRLKLPKTASNWDGLFDFLCRPLFLCDCVFRAFYAKDMTVFFISTDETVFNNRIQTIEGSGRLSFLNFIRWANPPELNGDKGMCKYSSRFALLLSSSAPFLVPKASIHYEPDIVSETGSVMTDGAGSIGRQIGFDIDRQFGWAKSTAFQVRVNGTKGLLVTDKRSFEDVSRIYVPPSMIKIKYCDNNTEPSHRMLDILRHSRLKSGQTLAVETIINLAEGGVPAAELLQLQTDTLKELVMPFLEWDGPDACLVLCKRIVDEFGVFASRRSRTDRGTARLNGYTERDVDSDDENEEDTELLSDTHQSTAWWEDPVSGSPSSLAETVADLLFAGFEPKNCPVLASKLQEMIQSRLETHAREYRIDVPMSCGAWIIPDKHGILEEGEIFVRSSTRNLLCEDGTTTDVLKGPVLVTRYPCKLPTDTQKWTAVDRPELYDITDMIVLSTKGSRRPADLLAGGDYDGDKAAVIWQPELVRHFTAQPLHFAEPDPDFNSKYFEAGEDVKADEFFNKISRLPGPTQIKELQSYLLSGVRTFSAVGKYSIYHENAIQKLGYRNQETKRLAYMFCAILDGTKSGLRVKSEVEASDGRKYDYSPRPWKEHQNSSKKKVLKLKAYNAVPLVRPHKLGPFIMDEIHEHSKHEADNLIAYLHNFCKENVNHSKDPHLTAPYQEAETKLRGPAKELYAADLNKIKHHVRQMFAKHKAEMAPSHGSPSKSRSAEFSRGHITTRQDVIRRLSREFAQSPDPSTMFMTSDAVAKVKASYAYIYDLEQWRRGEKASRFPWNVAFRDLCELKAKAVSGGLAKTVSTEFYQHSALKLPRA